MMLNKHGELIPVYNDPMKSTGHSRMGINTQDLGDNMAMGPNRRYARGDRITVKQPDTNITTDASVGAVIVNNVYVQDAPTGAADIHTLYNVTGAYPPSMLPSNPFFNKPM